MARGAGRRVLAAVTTRGDGGGCEPRSTTPGLGGGNGDQADRPAVPRGGCRRRAERPASVLRCWVARRNRFMAAGEPRGAAGVPSASRALFFGGSAARRANATRRCWGHSWFAVMGTVDAGCLDPSPNPHRRRLHCARPATAAVGVAGSAHAHGVRGLVWPQRGPAAVHWSLGAGCSQNPQGRPGARA